MSTDVFGVFGDSPLDLPMLEAGHRAFVVVGDEDTRSKSMERELLTAVQQGLQAQQVLFPSSTRPRLSLSIVPRVDLSDHSVVHDLLDQPQNAKLSYEDATDKPAAKLLMTPTRDARLSGPVLREAHRRVGHYLATEYLSEIIGLEEHPIPLVTGAAGTGHHFLNEKQTSIVAMMRGGEPMALGVSDVMPEAMFVHSHDHSDLKGYHLRGQLNVILVDSVINSGHSTLKYLKHIRKLHATIRIILVAGVIQREAITSTMFDGQVNIKLVALRLSDNKYTGSGKTDTGARLFNTTEIDHLEKEE